MRKAVGIFLLSLLLPFTAQADTCPEGTYFLNPDVKLTARTYDTTNMTWGISAPYGTISGIAVLNTTVGNGHGSINTSNFPTGTSGTYCWCKMTSPATSAWVYLDSVSSYSESSWNLMCVRGCVDNFAVYSDFRNKFFQSANNTCITCEAGYACSGGVKTNCADSQGPNGRPQYSAAGASSCTECPAVTGELASRVAPGAYGGWWPNNIHDGSAGCNVRFTDDDPDATYLILRFYDRINNLYGGTNSACYTYSYHVSACAAGKYNTITSASEYTSQEGRAGCYGVDCMKGKVCTDVGVGYYSPDGDTQRYECTNKPEHSSYSGSAASNSCPWECDANYTEYKNACHGFCSGNRKLRIGTNPITTYPAFSDKTNVPSPVLHIKDENDEICYIYFEPDVGGEHGVKVLWTDGKKYHAVDPTQ